MEFFKKSKMCSNPNCGYIKTVRKGKYCPECGSEIMEVSHRESWKWIKIKNEIKTGKKPKMHWREAERVKKIHLEEIIEENKKVKGGIAYSIFAILLVIGIVFACVVFFPFGLISLLLLPLLNPFNKEKKKISS